MDVFNRIISLIITTNEESPSTTVDARSAPPLPRDHNEMAKADQQNADYQKLFDRMLRLVDEAATVTNTSPAMAKLLLELCRWNAQSYYEAFFEHGSAEGLCQKFGVQMAAPNTHNRDTMCGICNSDSAELGGGECGHKFCRSCWNDYVQCLIKNAPKMVTIICPGHLCNNPIQDRFVIAQIGESATLRGQYVAWVARRFVDTNAALGWCKCERYLERPGLSDRPLRCRCGSLRCGNCSEEWHEPMDCDLMKKWKTRLRLDGQTMFWLKVNAKLCPRCRCAIQKNGGCNKVICTWMFCRYEFCWSCLQAWSTHESQELYICRSSKGDRLEWNEEIGRDELNCFNGFQKMVKDNCAFFQILAEKHEHVLIKLASDLQFRIVERMFIDDVIELIVRSALFVQYAWVFLSFVNHDQKKLFTMHLSSLQEAVRNIKERFVPASRDYTWNAWLENINPAIAMLKARYDCARRFSKIGIEQNIWNLYTNNHNNSGHRSNPDQQ